MRDEGALASLSSRDDPDGIVTLDILVPGVAAAASLKSSNDAPPASLLSGVLAAIGIAPADVAEARLAARMNASDLGRELVCAGRTTEEALSAAMAAAIGLPAEPILPEDQIVGETRISSSPMGLLRTCNAAGQSKLFLAPRLEALDALSRSLAALPATRSQARIATPSALARHRAAATLAERSREACLGLAGSRPALSARQVLTGTQGAVLAVFLVIIVWAGATFPAALLLVLHLGALPLFLAGTLFRLGALRNLLRPSAPPADANAAILRPKPHPAYSVLVALRDEAELVPALVAALAALRWPRSKLQVLIVCEADDPATVAAVETAIAGEPGFETVLVPPAPLRTKPKALNVALPVATGDFVVLFDAEDRPHPGQLEEAWHGFRRGGERLACLQAPLVIGNGAKNWLAAHFALEYAALFRGLLPWLARHDLPLPLGGTSNHFRRDALVAVGAWDSHNVTEDADLGIRLCRHGYRIGTIDTPTEEDAPERWPVWLKQRSRWMKGWIQTWLVHIRHPRRLWRELGPRGFAAFQILFVGMIGSSLAHPLCIVFLGWTLFSWVQFGFPGELACWLLGADLVSLVFGFGGYALLALKALEPEHRPLARHLVSVHAYWLLVSVAAARALVQLRVAPHRWEKTPHGRSAAARQKRRLSNA